jgi:hypothetical protein
MSTNRAATANSSFYGSKEGNDSLILINSDTVVEKKDFVATGVLTYVMGDIIEIEIPQFEVFQLGDKVKLTIYSQTGLFVFESTIVAKDKGALIVINPPENRKKFTEKREFPRVTVSGTGILHGMHDTIKNHKHKFDDPIHFPLHNISMSGVGFTLSPELLLSSDARLEVELNLGFPIPCVTQIVRKEKHATGIYYGAQYIEVPREKTTALRAYILKKQVETYFVKKREELHKKAVQDNQSVAND